MVHDYKSIFNSALEIQNDADRAKFLDDACDDDVKKRAQVESLLQAHAEAKQFMQPHPDAREQPVGPVIGETVGGYKLREEIGEGGMGVVYIAEQSQPVRRKVALKIIKPGMDTREVIARFQAERQALALMDHPNIAKVFDGGSTEHGRPYFVMELVRGVPITEYCDQSCLSTSERLALFITVSHAIQHAHRRGIIHRDIKPSNVLVSLQDGDPIVKIIDFGVAKAVNQQLSELSVYTRFQQVIGTPLYMSPEQAELSSLDIDTRTDVYSLGVLLYELLTGVTPFDRRQFATAAYDEMRRIIREEEPKKASTRISTLTRDEQSRVARQRGSSPIKLAQQLRGELDWILTKALEKDRRRRYDSASEFADDIQRYLRKKPVRAAAPSFFYTSKKFAARHRFVVATSGLVLATLLIGVSGIIWQSIRARRNEVAALHNVYVAEMLLARQAFDDYDTARAIEFLKRQIPHAGEPDFRHFEWHELQHACYQQAFSLAGHEGLVRKFSFTPDGTLLASGSEDLSIRVWDVASTRQLAIFKATKPFAGDRAPIGLDFSSDGKFLATLFGEAIGSSELVLWDVTELRAGRKAAARRFADVSTSVSCLKFVPNSNSVVVGDQDGLLTMVDIMDGTKHSLVDVSLNDANAHTGRVSGIDFTSDGKTMVTSSNDRTLKIWNIEHPGLVRSLVDHGELVHCASITSDGAVIASGGEDARTIVWRNTSDHTEMLTEFPYSAAAVQDASFSAGDDFLAVAVRDQRLVLYDTASWTEAATFRHPDGCRSVEFSRSGDSFVTGGVDPVIRGWNLNQIRQGTLQHAAPVRSVSFSPDGRKLAVGMSNGAVMIWNVESQRDLLEIPSPPSEDLGATTETTYVSEFSAFSSDSRLFATVGPTDTVSVWDIERRERMAVLKHPSNKVYSVTFSPDGQRLLTGTGNKSLVVWNWKSELKSATYPFEDTNDPIRCLRYSPDGTIVACACLDVLLLDANSFQVIKSLSPSDKRNNAVLHLTFSPDGKQLAGTEGERVVTVWQLATGQRDLFPHQAVVVRADFSPDGKRMVSSDFNCTTILWDMNLKQQIARYRGYTSDFSPNGQLLACGNFGSFKDASSVAKEVRILRALPIASGLTETPLGRAR